MKSTRLLLTPITVALLFGAYTANAQCPTPGPTVNGTKSISANVLGSTLTIGTSNAFAGAITSITWRGKQFIDAADHGREMQTAIFAQPLADAGVPDWVECYNANEAGSVIDTTSSTSKLRSISAVGNVLYTKSQMAFYLPPGGYGVCGEHGEGPAHNTCPLSKYILEKTVTIGFAGISNVIEYVAQVTIPEELARGEIVIATYGPSNLSWARKFEFRNKLFSDVIFVKDPKGGLASDSTNFPASLYDPNTSLGMAIYSPELMQPMQDPSHPIINPFLQWVMYTPPNPTSVFWGRFVQSTPYHTGEVATRRVYLVVGNYSEMQSALQQLHSYFYSSDPDVFDWQQYSAWNPDVANAMPGQYGNENHWNWWGLAEGRRAAVPFWAPAYLQRYPDISAYCGPTNYPCAAAHYVNYGRSEGRIGN